MEWISVEDRLPENMDEVLVFERWETKPFVGYWNGYHWFVDMTFITSTGRDGGLDDCIEQKYITHWMPLPKLPEYKNEEL